MSEAIGILREWCLTSDGHRIEIGAYSPLSFKARPWSPDELRRLESDLGIPLPEAFQTFALAIGAGSLFINEYGLGLEFYDPAEVRSASRTVWDAEVEADDPRTKSLLLVGEATGLGDHFGWALTEPFPHNFDVFCHEYPPTEYVATSYEVGTWRTFDDWIVHLVQTKGEPL
jgi:hypothetical protein